MNKIIISEHEGGELANQIWNQVSVLAYALERNVPCENWSFFEYPGIFKFRQPNFLVRTLFEPQFRGYTKRKSAFKTRAWRKLYKLLIVMPVRLFSRHILFSSEAGRDSYDLPPTAPPSLHLQKLEQSRGTVFIANVSGTVFRNRDGIAKHREKLVALLAPTYEIQTKVNTIFGTARSQYQHVVGVHIRQGDYKTFKGGRFAIEQARVREILGEFLSEKGWQASETQFLITSDGRIQEDIFSGLNILVSKNTVGTDIFTLAACDVIIGSDSTLSHFAAYYGNIPHIIMKKETMDWEYYKGKQTYFPNKYLTIMAY